MRTNQLLAGALAPLTTLAAAACGDDHEGDGDSDADRAPDADGGDDAPDAAGPATYRQVEHLARPGIAEALLLSNAFLEGYNATAPSYAGVPAPVLEMVVGEAKTVLKAVYLGTCLINGAVGLTTATGFQPAGLPCAAVGGDLFVSGGLAGTQLTQAAQDGAQAYADKVFGQFVPDVLRIDTAVPSAYLTLCGDATTKPLLCGGRQLNEDVIDITYNYLIAGAAVNAAAPAQFQALVSDGVHYQASGPSPGGVTAPDPSNPGQFHPPVSATFPYSAAPL